MEGIFIGAKLLLRRTVESLAMFLSDRIILTFTWHIHWDDPWLKDRSEADYIHPELSLIILICLHLTIIG